jgi:uncharacterized membrane protein YphA (DoxX/SURF4 family)
MKASALLLLRFTLGGLLVWWGLDKMLHVEHGASVAEHFYWGVGSGHAWLRVAGALELTLGASVIAGLLRRWTYPATACVCGVTTLGVWRSVIDPWGWFLTDTNVLFYPSAIIFAASLVLVASRDDDRLALDRSTRAV